MYANAFLRETSILSGGKWTFKDFQGTYINGIFTYL